MNPSLTYKPAYLGLYASQVLALACNAYLDIWYGRFGFEVLAWAVLFGFTLWVGWRQQGVITDRGQVWQKRILVLSLVLLVMVFLPIWGLVRGGLYMLATLQASYNCVTTTRRHLHLGLLVATVMATFAASHFRADWTMLFYILPFVVAAVFTLVAEQINRRWEEVRAVSLSQTVVGRQGAAIFSASLAILLLAAFLYAVVPQFDWPNLFWRYGAPAANGFSGQVVPAVPGGGATLDGGTSGKSYLTPAKMREAASRQGMPYWQAGMIRALADAAEFVDKLLSPVLQTCMNYWEAIKEWLKNHLSVVIMSLIVLLLISLLVAFWLLMREARAGTWLMTRYDYLLIGILGRHRQGREGAAQIYAAMERIFSLRDLPRSRTMNAREYLGMLSRFRVGSRAVIVEMTLLFEDARYGVSSPGDERLTRMRNLYCTLYKNS